MKISVPDRGRLLSPALLLGVALLSTVGCGIFATPRYTGPKSDHFDGERFFNPVAAKSRGPAAVLQWMVNREIGPWRTWVDTVPGPPPPRRVDDLRVTFVNHATTLVQFAGLNILTDPVWSRRVGPNNAIGPERIRPAGIRLRDLPPIDVIVVSHNHYDHMDLPTLRAIAERDSPCVFVPLGNSAFLAEEEVPGASDLDWWESDTVGGVAITCVPAVHRSGRGIGDAEANLWGGFVFSRTTAGPRTGSVYFAGDTGWGDHFEQIGSRLGPIRLALLPIGAYRPRWFMRPMHIDPTEAVAAHQRLGATTSVAIHWGTFIQSDEGEWEPAQDLAAARTTAGLEGNAFWVLQNGEGREVP